MSGRMRRYSSSKRAHRSGPSDPALSAGALDGGIVTAITFLSGIGLVMIYSVTAPRAGGTAWPPAFVRQLIALVAAFGCLMVTLRIPLETWRKLLIPGWVGCVAVLAATGIFGVEVNGAKRWLEVGPVRLQVAEFAKLTSLLALAAVLTGTRIRGARLAPLAAAGILCGIPVALMLMQPDFGNAAVLVAGAWILLYVAGTPLRQLALPALIAAVGAVAYIGARPYAHARWTGFLDPWATASREGFQLVQSYIAFSRGGRFGVGLGDGRQKLYYLPEGHTDFILSGVAEELGLFGVLLVLGAFAAFVFAGTRIALRAQDPFASIAAFAATAFVGIPAAINAAVVMGLLPTTGFTLPFVSFGANSLIVCSVAVGLLLRIGAIESTEPAASRSRATRVARAAARGLQGAVRSRGATR
jgi:cell division protein FtsW